MRRWSLSREGPARWQGPTPSTAAAPRSTSRRRGRALAGKAEDRQPQPLLRQSPGELRQSAGPPQSDKDAVTQNQEVASPQHQRQHESMGGGTPTIATTPSTARPGTSTGHEESRRPWPDRGRPIPGRARGVRRSVADATRRVGRLSPLPPLRPLRTDFPRYDTPVCPTQHRGDYRAAHPTQVYLDPPLKTPPSRIPW